MRARRTCEVVHVEEAAEHAAPLRASHECGAAQALAMLASLQRTTAREQRYLWMGHTHWLGIR